MAIEDAVEHINGFQGQGSFAQEYNDTFGGVSNQAFSGHYTGARGVQCANADWIGKTGLANRTERYWGFHFRHNSHAAMVRMLLAMEGTTTHGELRLLNTGALQVTRGTTGIATGSTILTVNVTYHISVWLLVHDTTGRFVVKLNGVTEIDFTGDTRNGGTGVQNRWRLGNIDDISQTFQYTDLVVLNGDHADADFVPISRVDSIFPSADGDITEGTPSTGTDNYALVDEVPPSGTDYVGFLASGEEDLYQCTDLPAAVGQVYVVSVVGHILKTDAGTGNAKLQIKSGGGTVTQGTEIVLSTSTLAYEEVFFDVPGGSGWTVNDVDDLQIGIYRTA